MAPDFEYLAHLSARRTIGHTLPGLVVLCLPLSLAALFLWHRLIQPAWTPLVLGRRAPPFAFGPGSRLAVLAFSALAGSLSHVAWDAFTHEHGLVVRHVGLLEATVPGLGVPTFQLLQYASSAAGAWFLAAWAHRHVTGWALPRGPVPGRALAPLLGVVAGAGASGAVANAVRVAATGGDAVPTLAAASIGAMAAATVAVIGLSVCLLRAGGEDGRAGERRRIVSKPA